MNVVAQIFDRFVEKVCLEISRCYSESILMKVSDIIIYLMKIMRISEIYKKALKVQILSEVALVQVVRKRVSFQDFENENTPKFRCTEI